MAYTKALGEILSHRQIADGIFDLTVKTPQASAAQIGQFMQIYCEGKTLRRPISICEINRVKETVRMVYMIKGEGTRWLSTQPVGSRLDLLGPLGHGFTVARAESVVVIGGGIGVPPMLETAKACPNKPDAILGFRSKNAAILTGDFKAACGNVYIATDDGSLGHHGFVTDLLKAQMEHKTYDLVCACGPIPMLKAIAGICAERGVNCQVSLEERMGCGIGACVSCVCRVRNADGDVRHAQVCRYGPVINAKEVVW